jgi:hypothetical protein
MEERQYCCGMAENHLVDFPDKVYHQCEQQTTFRFNTSDDHRGQGNKAFIPYKFAL